MSPRRCRAGLPTRRNEIQIGRNKIKARRNKIKGPAQRNQSAAQRNQNRFSGRRSRVFKGLRPFSHVAKPYSAMGVAAVLLSLACDVHAAAAGTDSEHEPGPFVNELSMRAEAAHPSRRAFRRSSGHGRDVLHPTALPPPAAASSALITASALVTVATFCTAKSIEALCHSAFIVEQQSSGRTTK